ncbi:hypothetical protein PGT21_011182 [Puccinia graminis f. sp. tritici]|uniref:Uncharacterized protein n=1 Tax=Puccinia graminis f. sp. tritici TaxID=56615 RepID=A0A5B0PXH5_PUCGR|nr:hypothetical protein PGT21_011182 [Puccinia graminis f. sp. tritici]
MFRSGQEFFFDGFLAGWDLKDHVAIIQVLTVSPVGIGNQNSTLKGPSSPVNKGQKF